MVSDIISALMKNAGKLEEEIADLEEVVSQRKAVLAKIMEDDIPAVLHENGIASLELADGRTVGIESIINVRQENKGLLAAWLYDHGYDSVIKTDVSFGKGADSKAIEAILQGAGYEYVMDKTIHPQTLKALFRQHLSEGGEYPPGEAATVTVFERAKVKEARQ